MPVPATTGRLRINIADMQIGDYIVCNYTASSGAVGMFSNFGETAGAEIPVGGSSAPNGTFYFIKVAKGLLVADRVVQHSISWDVLNSRSAIQGIPCLLSPVVDAVPTMTSNNAPSGIVRSDSIWSSGCEAWKAFSDSIDFNGSYTTSGWMSGTATTGTFSTDVCWISYEFPTPKEIKGIALVQLGYNAICYRCKDFSVQCSNDGTTWQTVYRGAASPNFQKQLYTFNSVGAKKFWRFVIYSHCHPGQNMALGIAQLELLEQVPNIGQGIIRSLTGGVAYADANGNKSTTDQGTGLTFPTINEFDKYILGFDQTKIQSGKTLADVFHHDVIKTWTQDTPIISIAASTNRVARGGTTGTNNFSYLSSSTANTAVGFRPVFEYQE